MPIAVGHPDSTCHIFVMLKTSSCTCVQRGDFLAIGPEVFCRDNRTAVSVEKFPCVSIHRVPSECTPGNMRPGVSCHPVTFARRTSTYLPTRSWLSPGKQRSDVTPRVILSSAKAMMFLFAGFSSPLSLFNASIEESELAGNPRIH
ncbi:unnamed protein product, partial [Ectocarpus sp. 12 AP-2014]